MEVIVTIVSKLVYNLLRGRIQATHIRVNGHPVVHPVPAGHPRDNGRLQNPLC